MSRRIRSNLSNSAAFSLLELVVVLAVLAIVAGMVVLMISGMFESAASKATLASMRELQTVILDRYRIDMAGKVASSNDVNGFGDMVRSGLPGPDANNLVPSTRTNHPQLLFLFSNPTTNSSVATFDPVTGRGWRRPYFSAGQSGRYPGRNSNRDIDEATFLAGAVVRGFTNQFGEIGDETVLDGWGNPIIIRLGTYRINPSGPDMVVPVLESAGADGDLNSTADNIKLPLQ